MSETFYVLRYREGTALKDRKHQFTTGRHNSWLAAETSRVAQPSPYAEQLDVVERTVVAEVPC